MALSVSSVRSLFQFLGMGLLVGSGLCTLLGFLAGWGWPFELFAHFRPQYAETQVFCVLLFLLLQSRRWLWVGLVFVAANLSLILPFYVPPPDPIGPVDTKPLKILHLNVLTSNRRFEDVAALIRKTDADVLSLQEVNIQWLEKLSGVLKQYPYDLTYPQDNNFGIGLFSKVPFTRVVFEYPAELPPHIDMALFPSIVGSIRWNGREVHLLTTHPLPPGRQERVDIRNRQLMGIAKRCRSLPRPVVLLGDLNTTPWSPVFQDVLETCGLKNSQTGFGLQPTWPSDSPLLLIPIDHVLVSPEISVIRRSVGPAAGSDHLPVTVELGIVE